MGVNENLAAQRDVVRSRALIHLIAKGLILTHDIVRLCLSRKSITFIDNTGKIDNVRARGFAAHRSP